jgi:uncharacterized heparinase superfamily protein
VASNRITLNAGLSSASARHGLRRLKAGLHRVLKPTGGRAPDRLIMAPQDLRTSDPTIAAEIYAGHLKFAGKLLETHGHSPFGLAAPSAAFEAELHGFSWLRHLRAAETMLAKTNGRALVSDWIAATRGAPRGVAAEPVVTARRVLSWISQSPLLLDKADASFYRMFLKALGQEIRRLERALIAAPPTELRLLIQIALTSYTLAASEKESDLRAATAQLCAVLEAQILPDGGHISRNPGVVLDLLVDLLPLKLAFAYRRIQTPQSVVSAIDRMMLMLRMMRHTDGSLALFNGMSATRTGLVAAVIAQDDVMAGAPSEAPYTGYQRIETGGSVLIADAGAAGRPPNAGRAHAAPAAFEFSASQQRIFINCGAPPLHRTDVRPFARLTAAHTTLVVNDENIGRFRQPVLGGAAFGDQWVNGPRHVSVQRATLTDGIQITIEHDGYGKSLGLVHQRRLALSAHGLLLEGADTLRSDDKHPDVPYALRFHLHPQVKPALQADSTSVVLELPSGQIWLFEASGIALALEESILFASPDALRRTSQIVVATTLSAHASVAWSLRQTLKQ